MDKRGLERIAGGGRAFMKTINCLPAISDNSGHTVPLRSAQIPHLWFWNFVCPQNVKRNTYSGGIKWD